MASRSKAKEVQKKQHTLPIWVEKALFWFLFALVLFAPYYRGLYFRLERLPFFLLICGAVAVLAILRSYYRVPFFLPLHLAIPFTLFVLLYGVNIALSADRGLAYQEFLNWAVYCLFFLVIASFRKEPSKLVLLLFGGNVVVLTLMSLLQGFGLIREGLYFPGMSLRALFLGGRLHSTFQYPNTASAYLGMGYLALLGVTFWERENEAFRALASFLAFLALAGTFFTYSRGGILVLGLVLLVLLFVLPQKMRAGLFSGILTTAFPFLVLLPLLERFLHTMQPLPFFGVLLAGGIVSLALREILVPFEERVATWRPQRFLLGITLLLVATGGVFLFAVHSGLVGGGATRLLDVSLRTRSVWERLVFYRDGLKIFAQRPLNGWGGGGWEALYLSVRSFPYATRSTHNFYLQILIEGGIIGAVLLALLLYYLFRGMAQVLRKDPTPWLATLFGLLLLGFLHGFVDVDFDLGAYQLAVWFFAGCAAAVFPVPQKDRKQRAHVLSHPLVFGAAALAILILIALSVIAERQRTFGQYPTREGMWDDTIYFLTRAARFEPWDPDTHLSLSKAFREKFSEEGEDIFHQKAVEEAEKALRLAPWNFRILEYAGVLHAERGNFERGILLLKRAIAANPFELHPYLNLTKVCHYAARYLLGKGEKEKALFYLKEGIAVKDLLDSTERHSLEPLKWDTSEIHHLIEEMENLMRETTKP